MVEQLGTFLLQQMDYVQAERCYEQALQIAGPILDLARLGRIYHGRGRCCYGLGDAQRGIELVSRAVALYAVENDLRPAAARIDLPRVENDLGVMLLREGQPERAVEFFLSALRRLEEAGAERLQSHYLLSLAEARQVQDRLEEAVELIERALELAHRLEERRAEATANRQLGEIHELRGEHDLADQRFQRALAILDEARLPGVKADCLAAYERMLGVRGATARLERSAG